MYDIIIVGGGPAGLAAAIYAARALKKVLLIEKATFGGQITQAVNVENYPGFETIGGMELGERMYDQAKKLGMESIYGEVSNIQKDATTFTIFVSSKEYQSKALIYATGASPRKLGVVNEEKLLGSGISYCATCDGAFFKDKTVCVVGGGNTAIDDALYLSNLCKKVYLIHRRDGFRGEPVKVTLLKEKENVKMEISALTKENFKPVHCLDNDETASQIACLLKPHTLLILTSVDGIYSDHKDKNTLVKEISGKDIYELIENISHFQTLCDGASRKGAGGAKAKLEYIKEPAKNGTRIIIANSKYPIKKILENSVPCTLIQVK